jgi:hypothetical protein
VIDWQEAKAAFDWDGSLRDIYIVDTDRGDWERLLAFLGSSRWPWRFTIGGEPAQLPADVATLLSDQGPASEYQNSPLLSLDVAGVTLHCHFFWPKEIEFDLDPRQVVSAESLSAVLDFMATLGRRLDRPVVLTPENLPQRPYFRFDPDRQSIIYVPYAGRSVNDGVGHSR